MKLNGMDSTVWVKGADDHNSFSHFNFLDRSSGICFLFSDLILNPFKAKSDGPTEHTCLPTPPISRLLDCIPSILRLIILPAKVDHK